MARKNTATFERTLKAVSKTLGDEAESLKDAQQKINDSFRENPLLWGMLYMNKYFTRPGSPFHLKVMMEIQKNKKIAIQAPRGSSKSTIVTMKLAHGIAYGAYRHIIVVQNTFAKAAQTLNNIKYEFKEKYSRLKADFGVRLLKDADGEAVFVTADGKKVRVLCKGADQIGSIRGERFEAYRPDLIFIDDLEDDEMVRNAERRRILEDLFNDVLKYAGETGDSGGTQFIVIGTILHDDSLMAKLLRKDIYTDFRKLFFRAKYKDKQGVERSLWPEKWSLEYLEAEEKANPASFAKEMMGDPVYGAMSDINPEDFRYWRMEEGMYLCFDKEGHVVVRGDMSECKAVIACDLAWETKRESDFSVIMPAFLTPESFILIGDYVCKKGMRPDELIETLFSMERSLNALTNYPVHIGFEKAKLEKVILFLLKKEMRKRNKWLITKDILWDADKIQRIITRCQPRYAQHAIFHKKGMGDLESQLVRLRSTAHDDLADCLQAVCQLLDTPRHKRKQELPSEDPMFDKLRKIIKENKNPSRKQFIFCKKGRLSPVKAEMSIF